MILLNTLQSLAESFRLDKISVRLPIGLRLPLQDTSAAYIVSANVAVPLSMSELDRVWKYDVRHRAVVLQEILRSLQC